MLKHFINHYVRIFCFYFLFIHTFNHMASTVIIYFENYSVTKHLHRDFCPAFAGIPSVLIGIPAPSIWWKYFTSWKFSLPFVYIFKADWKFFIKIFIFDPSFNRNTLSSLHLNFKPSAHAKILVTHYYVLFTNFLTWYEFKTYIG